MKKLVTGHNRPSENSSRSKKRRVEKGKLPRKSASQAATTGGETCFTCDELMQIETLKAERDSLKEVPFPKAKNKKPRKGSTRPPTNWTEYHGSMRDENGRVRFAVEALGSEALNDVLLNGPPDPKYGVGFDIPALMKEVLACAKDTKSLPSARAHALMLFDFLGILVHLITNDWSYTLAAMAFVSGGICNRLREGETLEAAKKGDVAHRGRQKAGKNRAKPDVWAERMRLFELEQEKAVALGRRPHITNICRDIATVELQPKLRRPPTSKELEYRADTIERQLRKRSPEAFPLLRRNSPEDSSKQT